MQIIIEPVQEAEIEKLVTISRTTFYETFHEQNTEENMQMFLDETFSAEALEVELNDPNNFFYFARQSSQIVGYLKLIVNSKVDGVESEVALEVARIYVTKESIGLGVGKELIQFAIDLAKQRYLKQVWLGVWEHNERAIKFYQKFGFKKFGEHTFAVGDDPQNDWLMKLDL